MSDQNAAGQRPRLNVEDAGQRSACQGSKKGRCLPVGEAQPGGLFHSRCSLREKGDVSLLKLHGGSDVFSRGGRDVKPCCRTRMDYHTPSASYGMSRTSLCTESETDPLIVRNSRSALARDTLFENFERDIHSLTFKSGNSLSRQEQPLPASSMRLKTKRLLDRAEL
jgi:hypothetical protein